MTGKVGAARKGKRYRNYYCSRATRSRGLCSVYNGHSAPKLEKVILEYLEQFSDPEKVRDYLAAAERIEIEGREAELRDVEKRIADSDPQFLQHLDLLKRGLLNEQEFRRANEAAREKTRADEAKRIKLTTWLNREHSMASRIERVPGEIKTFIEAFQATDPRQQKAQLQTILKAAYIYRDGRIELEFRDTNVQAG